LPKNYLDDSHQIDRYQAVRVQVSVEAGVFLLEAPEIIKPKIKAIAKGTSNNQNRVLTIIEYTGKNITTST
jgi:hypothetical protein